jgi:hypothetical protein
VIGISLHSKLRMALQRIPKLTVCETRRGLVAAPIFKALYPFLKRVKAVVHVRMRFHHLARHSQNPGVAGFKVADVTAHINLCVAHVGKAPLNLFEDFQNSIFRVRGFAHGLDLIGKKLKRQKRPTSVQNRLYFKLLDVAASLKTYRFRDTGAVQRGGAKPTIRTGRLRPSKSGLIAIA